MLRDLYLLFYHKGKKKKKQEKDLAKQTFDKKIFS